MCNARGVRHWGLLERAKRLARKKDESGVLPPRCRLKARVTVLRGSADEGVLTRHKGTLPVQLAAPVSLGIRRPRSLGGLRWPMAVRDQQGPPQGRWIPTPRSLSELAKGA
jgi:hypothetical protein